jgi:hypothetical protein
MTFQYWQLTRRAGAAIPGASGYRPGNYENECGFSACAQYNHNSKIRIPFWQKEWVSMRGSARENILIFPRVKPLLSLPLSHIFPLAL